MSRGMTPRAVAVERARTAHAQYVTDRAVEDQDAAELASAYVTYRSAPTEAHRAAWIALVQRVGITPEGRRLVARATGISPRRAGQLAS